MNLDMKLKFNFNKRNKYKMTASDYTHLFGYLNPYYRTAYSIPKRKR